MTERRAILRRIGAAVGVVGSGSLAGCSASDLPGIEPGAGDADGWSDGSGDGGDGGADDGGPTEGTADGSTVGTPASAEGEVKDKQITTSRESGARPLVWGNASELTVRADTDVEFAKGNITVEDAVAEELEAAHGELAYWLIVELETDDPVHEAHDAGDRVRFRLDRELFNAVGIGTTVRFVIAGEEEPRIEEFVAR